MDVTAALARSITWASSKQTYYTARLMVDKDLVDDCYRAYAYFRWADDIIDISSPSHDERISFIKRQRELIDRLYKDERLDDLTQEEKMIADLISHDRADNADRIGRTHPGENSGLESFIRNFLAVIEFDARRKGRLISQQELTWYSDCLGKSVTDGLQYFIGNGHPYPVNEYRYLAATAAHIVHQLRDMLADIADGFINIPREYLEAHDINLEDVSSPPFRAWVRDRVEQARQYFYEGKRYLDELAVLRCKIVGYWYCARFEGVLDAIERDGYTLRAAYSERRNLSTWLKIGWLAVSVALRHVARRDRRDSVELSAI
jgi:phytoene/squalene synthetase